MLLLSIIYFFTETLNIFFFVGTGISVKEYTQAHKIDICYHERTKQIKKKLFPSLMMNLLAMMVLVVLAGAVDTGRFPLWGYRLLFVGIVLHFFKLLLIQNASFRENTDIILKMSEAKV